MITATNKPVRRQRIRRVLLFFFLMIFPFTMNYYSMVLPVMGALEGTICFSVFFWSAWAFTSGFLGRSACGWVCPLAAAEEIFEHASPKPLKRVRFLPLVKWILFTTWIGLIVWAMGSSGGIERVDLLYKTENVTSWANIGGNYIWFGMFLVVFAFAVPLGRRAFCHYGCWFSPLNILGMKLGKLLNLPRLRLTADTEACTSCGRCEKVCVMSLPIQAMVETNHPDHDECVLCGQCVDHCKTQAVRYRFGRN